MSSLVFHLSSVSDFEILGKIGEGSYSEVFRVVHRKTGAIFALKIIKKEVIKKMMIEDALVREIKINMYLDHPNLAKLYHFFDDEAQVYLICEYATNKNVYELANQPRLKLKKGLFSGKVANIIGQLCEGVRFMHNHFVIHRDIKPENVLLTMVIQQECSSIL